MILELNDQEMDYLFKVLSNRPWGEVVPLMSKISQQVKEQNDARNPPSSPPEPDGEGGAGRP